MGIQIIRKGMAYGVQSVRKPSNYYCSNSCWRLHPRWATIQLSVTLALRRIVSVAALHNIHFKMPCHAHTYWRYTSVDRPVSPSLQGLVLFSFFFPVCFQIITPPLHCPRACRPSWNEIRALMWLGERDRHRERRRGRESFSNLIETPSG